MFVSVYTEYIDTDIYGMNFFGGDKVFAGPVAIGEGLMVLN